ncbi:unnamed protein product [Cylindrotheca closterium]|uniref:Amine oxidase n=1 Tax=Cylindrotheca closterium TaxID=2856 RepID=A0AAD2CNI1_9STRA|nr:unnamed protein product [Cylindrotheca closterium]
MKPSCEYLVFLALLVGSKALDLELRKVVCDETLPAYIATGDINWRCNGGSTSCSMGEHVYITGGLTYNQLGAYLQNNSTAYASAKLQMLTLEYELFQLLPFNFCGDFVTSSAANGNMTNYTACPDDGRYTFNLDYTLPENQDSTSWFASGWTATSEIMIYSSRTESSTILADCKLEFHTYVTHDQESAQWKELPSAATITFALLTVAMFLCVMVCFLACRKTKTQEANHEFDDFQKYIDSIDDEETVDTHVEVARKISRKLSHKYFQVRACALQHETYRNSEGRRLFSSKADIVVVGGGVSGLTAAISASKAAKESGAELKIVLAEGSSKLGGRVQSEVTDDGFVLDIGFAVFIDQYPQAKKLLDFDSLQLKPFLPGALVKLDERETFARVSDPLRQPKRLVGAITSPIGSLADKLKLGLLILNVRRKSISELFEEEELDTETALRSRWRLSESIVETFFRPFLQGVYLAPLNKQSSRMFSFVFKMFNEGAATLPRGGMKAVSEQLAQKALDAGVEIRKEMPISSIYKVRDGSSFVVESKAANKNFETECVIVATEGPNTRELISQVEGFESIADLPKQPQLSVGCMYYSFLGDPPVDEPILILNGKVDSGLSQGADPKSVVNTMCFPSVVNEGYAPKGSSLCSVSISGKVMEDYEGKDEELDAAVRSELASWFKDRNTEILEKWKLRKIYHIHNAQPAQLNGPCPSNVNGGRPCTSFQGMPIPDGMVICGDHVATASLNGALESGAKAGAAAAEIAVIAKK